MKYIKHKIEGFFLFHPPMLHTEMVRRLRYDRAHIESAGFVKCINSELVCYGRSESLGVSARAGDTEELQAMHDVTNSLCV